MTAPASTPSPRALAGSIASGLASAICGADIEVSGEQWDCDTTFCPTDGSSDLIEAEFDTPKGRYSVVLRVVEVGR